MPKECAILNNVWNQPFKKVHSIYKLPIYPASFYERKASGIWSTNNDKDAWHREDDKKNSAQSIESCKKVYFDINIERKNFQNN